MLLKRVYYVKLRANFKLDKFENLLIQAEHDWHSFVCRCSAMGRKWPRNHFQSLNVLCHT